MFWFLNSFLILIMGLLSIAFLTLMERKVLSYSQVRMGPNKTLFQGMIQPVLDGLKLLGKQISILWKVQWLAFIINPVIMFCIFITIWCWIIPWNNNLSSNKFSFIMLLFVLGISAYAVILSGWASSSVFSKLGSMRGMLQNISFEILLAIMYMSSFIMIYNMMSFKSEFKLNLIAMSSWGILWLFLALLESNRAPFDLSEGESELISGFNIEMGALSFILLFLSEYGSIVIMSMLMLLGLMGSSIYMSVITMFLLLLFRSCFPRLRYDIMVAFTWMVLLPNILMFLFMIMTVR